MLNYRKHNLRKVFVEFFFDSDDNVASRLKNIPISRLESKNHTQNSQNQLKSFSSPEAALLSVSTKNRDFWLSPIPEVRDSRTSCHPVHAQSQVWQIWLVLIFNYWVYKAIQNQNVVGPGQRSRFLVLTKRSAACGDENELKSIPYLWLKYPLGLHVPI